MAATTSIKTLVLTSVTIQNSAYTLLRRYSQGVLREPVRSAEVLIVGELLKLLASAWVTTHDNEATDAQGVGGAKLVWLAANSAKMLVLALIYGAMNVLSFVALKRIDAAAFTVCAQLKILTTAFFSVLILKRHLTWTKWRALVLVVVASILVSSPSITSSQLPDCDGEASSASSAAETATDDLTSSYQTAVGFIAVLAEVTLSGFASIYFERVIKATNVKLTIWDRNFQLALWSIVLYVIMIMHDSVLTGRPIGSGWSFITFIVACLGALGGILVALSVKYSDSIMKSIAVSGAIVLSGVGGYLFLDGPMTLPMALGSVAAIIATQNYTFDTESSSKADRKIEAPPSLSLHARGKQGPHDSGAIASSPTSAACASV